MIKTVSNRDSISVIVMRIQAIKKMLRMAQLAPPPNEIRVNVFFIRYTDMAVDMTSTSKLRGGALYLFSILSSMNGAQVSSKKEFVLAQEL